MNAIRDGTELPDLDGADIDVLLIGSDFEALLERAIALCSSLQETDLRMGRTM